MTDTTNAGGAAPTPAPSPTPDGGTPNAALTPAPNTPPANSGNPPAPPPTPTPTPEPKAPDGQQPPVTDFKVPDAYKDKPWAAKVKSLDDVFQQIDTLDALKGKKTIAPDLKTATPEEREAYYAQTRPQSAAAYAIPDDINGVPVPAAVKEGVGKIFLENGISEVQGNAVIKAYNEIGKQQLAEQFDENGFKTSMETAFGADWQKITGQTRNTIKGMMNADDQAMLDKLPNAYLGVIYRTLGNVVKTYGVKETDQAHFSGSGQASGGGDVTALRASIRADMAKMGSQPHTTEQYQALQQKLADTYKNDPRLQGAR